MAGHYLPTINEWPYKEVNCELSEFRLRYNAEPKQLIVGPHLWELLVSVSSSKDSENTRFCLQDRVTVVVDTSKILEPSEFIFSVV